MLRILCRLAADVVKMSLFLAYRVAEQFVGLAVRLFYLGVRRYGFARVGWFLAAFGTGLLLWSRVVLPRPVSPPAQLAGVVVATAAVYGSGLLVARWVRGRGWRLWVEKFRAARRSPRAAGEEMAPIGAPAGRQPEGSVPGRGSARSLWECFLAEETLREARQRVLLRGGGPGIDGVTAEAFALDAEAQLTVLATELREGHYRPLRPRWVEVVKGDGGIRRLAVLAVRDRVVQVALHMILSPVWERRLLPCSYAYRPGRSALQAVAAVEAALKEGRHWVVDADIASFFDRVPHERLFKVLEGWLPDERLREVVRLSVIGTSLSPGLGLAQGAPLSPLLANVYLHAFDEAMLGAGHRLVRYSDDFVVLCATRRQAEEALRTAGRLLEGLGLELKPEKTRIVNLTDGFTFLGYDFTPAGKRPSEKAVASLRQRLSSAASEATRRQILAGWQGYFGEAEVSWAAAGAAAEREGTEGRLPRPGERETPPMECFGPDTVEEEPWWEDAVCGPDLEEYRRRFVGRRDVFGRFWKREDGRHGYAPVRRPLTSQDLESHLRGEEVLATYLLEPDGTTRALVLDVDGPEHTEEGRAAARVLSIELAAAFVERGTPPLLFASGGKGFHLWFCFQEPVPARLARLWVRRCLEELRPYPAGVLVEVFPKQDRIALGALGSLIRLPLGRHPGTGEWSRLLDLRGREAAEPWRLLKSAPLIAPSALASCQGDRPVVPAEATRPPAGLAQLADGCSLVRALVRKAVEQGRLRHAERLALLYVLGATGEEGRVYLHQVIACCHNYDPRITERWIRRLREGRKPIRCTTIREWLRDHLPAVRCDCELCGRARSPLDLLGCKPGAPNRRTAAPAAFPEEEWKKVAPDLFPAGPDEAAERPEP